jgi:hypothetical protein
MASIVVWLFLAAVLYTAVGHAGASGYLAVMAFYAVAPETMRPAALVLNVIAAVPTFWRFTAAGMTDRRMIVWLAVGSVPFALLGSPFQLPSPIFRWLIASALILAAVRLAWPLPASSKSRHMPTWVGPLIGAPIGLLAGLTGIGGGVYLTPILLFARWADVKKAAGISATFILLNSLAGLIGQANRIADLPPDVPIWGIAVLLGGLIGSTLGSRYLAPIWLRRLLAAVLIVAVVKLMV